MLIRHLSARLKSCTDARPRCGRLIGSSKRDEKQPQIFGLRCAALKMTGFWGRVVFGTTEVVPFHKALWGSVERFAEEDEEQPQIFRLRFASLKMTRVWGMVAACVRAEDRNATRPGWLRGVVVWRNRVYARSATGTQWVG